MTEGAEKSAEKVGGCAAPLDERLQLAAALLGRPVRARRNQTSSSARRAGPAEALQSWRQEAPRGGR